MNLVNLIRDQLTNDVTSKLGGLTEGDEAQTKSALGAAVPALLSAISGMASGGGNSADKLASAINKFDAGSLGKLTDMLSSDPEQALQQGNNLLGSLFGGSTLSGLAGAISRFAGLDAGTVKKLLAYVSPLVLGAIAKQFQGQPASAQGLKSLFAEQQANIAEAVPAGLSLADVPGLPDVRSAATNMAATAQRETSAARDTGSSLAKTLLPIAGLVLLAFLAWQYFRGAGEQPAGDEVATTVTEHTTQRPVTDMDGAMPDVTRVSDSLNSVYTTVTETLSDITDVASAEEAMPKLSDLSTKVDGLAALKERLPAAARSTIAQIAADNIGPLTKLIEKVLAIPGVGEKLEPTLNGLLTKLKSLEE